MNIKGKYINNTVIVSLENGEILFKTGVTQDFLGNLYAAESEDEIRVLMENENLVDGLSQEDRKNNQTIIENYQLLLDTGEFTYDGQVWKMVGINRSIPELLVKRLIFALVENKSDDYIGLKNFWMWCCLNPRAEVADDLFGFLEKNCFKINKQGMFFALRNVVTVDVDNELVHFVSQEYNKIKGIWKKDPKDYTVYKYTTKDHIQSEQTNEVKIDPIQEELEQNYYDWDGDVETLATLLSYKHPDYFWGDLVGYAEDWINRDNIEPIHTETRINPMYILVKQGERPNPGYESVGELHNLYMELPAMSNNRFTDAHTGTFDIRIGQKVSMPPEECVWNNKDCAHAGLHFTLNEIHYVGCGDTSILILINPSKVVGIGQSKGRCYEYLPLMTIPREEATTFLQNGEFDTIGLEENYALEELTGLEDRVKESFIKEAKKHEYNLPILKNDEIKTIVGRLNSYKDAIKDRVNII